MAGDPREAALEVRSLPRSQGAQTPLGGVVASGRSAGSAGARTLGEAGRSVFGTYESQPPAGKAKPCTLRLCWMLVGVFLIVTSLVCFALTILWIQTAADETKAVNDAHKGIRARYENVSERAVDALLHELVLQDMYVERLAVAEYINMPYLAVEMLGGAMDQKVVTVDGVNTNVKQLWWLQTKLPTLEKRFAWGGIPKLESVFYADQRGFFASYSNECAKPGQADCNGDMTYALHMRPPDDPAGNGTASAVAAAAVGCSQATCQLSANMTPQHVHYYVTDTQTGKPSILVAHQEYDPRERPWWKRAASTFPPQIVWTELHVLRTALVDYSPSRRLDDDTGPLRSAYGFSVSRAYYDDEGGLAMVAGATLRIGHISDILIRRVTLAAQNRPPDSESCIFIVDDAGRMIASSTGVPDVLCEEAACAGRQLMWNSTGSDLIKTAVASLLQRFPGGLAHLSNYAVHVDKDTRYIYSHFRLESGRQASESVGSAPSPGTRDLRWIIVRAQPITAYEQEILEEKAKSEQKTQQAMVELYEKLDNKELVTLILCGCFLVVGALGLSCISWLVSRRLKTIANDMDKVARLDFSSCRPGGLCEASAGTQAGKDAATPDFSPEGRSSQIHEIAHISKAFHNMTSGLQSFARYMDPHIVQLLVQSGQQARLGVAKAKVTVFFSDIADFTKMAEALEPRVLAELLGEYLEEMSGIIMEHSGIVGEFIGDEIMAWWNAPWDLGSRHTVMAFSAAMEQQNRLGRLRQQWVDKGLPEVKVRMGLVCGHALAGNIGSQSRMKYGLVGDNVNLASRLEQLCKKYGVGILVDSKTCDEEGVRDTFFVRTVDLVTVKGRTEPTELCELVACKEHVRGTPLLDMYSSFCSKFTEIHELYRTQDFNGALEKLEAYRQIWPEDRPAKMMQERCRAHLECPPGSEWTAVEHLHEK